MKDDELLRYSRHILLPDIDIAGQERLLASHVAIIGLGGLGSPVALYLSASGVGSLTLVDDDDVDLGNLQRQIVHSEAAVGTSKVESAKTSLSQINQTTDCHLIHRRLDSKDLATLAGNVDIIVDCTDNFETRFAINRACVEAQTPLVSGAAIRFEGQQMVWDPSVSGSPCYACLYGDQRPTEQNCATTGVVAPLVGIIGSLLALETLKLVLGIAREHTGRLTTFDAMTNRWHSFIFKQRSDCPICGPADGP